MMALGGLRWIEMVRGLYRWLMVVIGGYRRL